AGHNISHVDLGGGLGAPYKPDDVFPSPEDYGAMVRRVTSDWEVQLVFEPGRVIVANAGVLLTRVIRVKPGMSHPFVIVDAAMNDLARPAMYDAYHHFESVMAHSDSIIANIVGPICESSDTFAMERSCTQVEAGDLAVFRSAGAYGATMASTYNSRDMVPEVLVSGDKFAIVADRIAAATIMAAERVPDWI
ncbi:MAG: diaminopimelate decarboxylase, partial [Alphaproteobacteria bacterium]|nr:diaminopimelate decarboxylase [Alphaproteobacteria bacterium]